MLIIHKVKKQWSITITTIC